MTTLASDDTGLFLICGTMGGCKGDGGLFRVDTESGVSKQLGGNDWKNAGVHVMYVCCIYCY